jgi:hypothetical protein
VWGVGCAFFFIPHFIAEIQRLVEEPPVELLTIVLLLGGNYSPESGNSASLKLPSSLSGGLWKN